MIISVNWLKKFTDIDVSTDELATLIGARLVEIEDVVDLGAKYDGVVVGRVAECEKLEGSDHLNVTKIDDGGVTVDIERDENGLVQVVCGAPNVRAGMMVAWLPPKSTVPESFNDKEPFVLEARKLRGVVSNGMLASAKELDLFEDHDGILELHSDVQPGAPFADVLELNDQLLNIENKSLTHRPDTFGIIGFAREVAAIQGKAFQTPAWLSATQPEYGQSTGAVASPSVTIDVPGLSARYQAVVLSGADGAAVSPIDVQTYLARVGVRPISAIVDVTNYLMMVTGQPLHAFDYDKLVALNNGIADIHVRAGKTGESLQLIDGRTVELSDNDIVIANGDTAVALAGAMGGKSTEIDASTKNIILESATFNLYNLRNTQMRHGIFSEAITRFTKGQPAQLTAPVLAAAVQMLQESAGAVRVSDVADTMTDLPAPIQIEVSIDMINSTLGSKFAAADIVDTLQNVEFTVAIRDDGAGILATAPFWRSDIHIAEDIIEEIGRLNGFDSIEPTLPERDFTAVSPDSFDQLRATVRQTLARAGANEVLTYSFVHGDLLRKATLRPDNSYRIINSISPDLQYYRQTLTPSLLNLVHANSKAGYDAFALFELNKVHAKSAGMTDDGVPVELDRVGLVLADRQQKGAAFYQAKRLLEYLGESLGLQLLFKPLPESAAVLIAQPFEYRRSARVIDVNSGMALGIVGEYKKSVTKNFKLPLYAAGFELVGEGLVLAASKAPLRYQPSSRYPSTTRDICFRVNEFVSYASIIESLAVESIEEVTITVQPIDMYQAAGEEGKNITVRLTITPYTETLNSDAISGIVNTVSTNVIRDLGAKIV